MHRLLKCVLTVLAIAGPLALAPPTRAELPPIIDRALIFGDPEISSAQLSPDGTYMTFIKPYRDVRNVWLKKREEPFDAAKPLTADSQPVTGYFWSQDSKFVLYVQDKGGNENYHVYAVDPAAAPEAETGVPPARDLTPLEKVRAFIYAVPEEKPDEIIVGLNDRDATYHDVYRVKLATGERTLLIENTQKVGFWVYDDAGDVRLAYRQKEDGGNELLRVEGGQLVPIYDVTYLEEVFPQGWDPDEELLYIRTNKGDEVDLARLELLDPATGKTEIIESDPKKEVDLGGAVFDGQTDELMATYYVGDRVRIYPITKRAKQDLKRMQKELPDGDYNLESSTRDMRYSLVSVSSDVEPGATYLYDREKGTFTLQYRVREELPREHLAPMKAMTYTARDGMTIHGYLTVPKDVPAKNLPLVLHPHGGPWARDTWGYDGYAQFLANRGYAVFQPNFRSSSGYGQKFLNAGNHEWGTGTMQHDLTDAVSLLVTQGIADPKRVCIFGGSYGGYATLAGVTFTPELYACAIPYVAPSSLITLIESFPAYWRPFLKGSWYMRVGDPEVPADRKDLESRSPIHFIDKIQVPMLVVHGANDPRVKQAESDAIVVALRDKGHPVEYIVAPDEGHGFRAPDNRMALAVAMEKFLAKHLGGRAQEEMPADLAAHLASITVDPATVKVAKGPSAEMVAMAATAPLPAADGGRIRPVTLAYGVKLEAGGRTMDLSVNRSIAEAKHGEQPCWRLTDALEMGGTTMHSTFDVDRKTLVPLRYESTGMANVTLDYTSQKITGEMAAGGGKMPIDKALDAPVFGGDAAFIVALAGLPLADGYQTTYRIFEPSSQKVRAMLLTVERSEKVTVKAGEFDAYVVGIQPLDGDDAGTATMHVTKSSPHQLLKSSTKLPATMGGGTMTSELSSMTIVSAEGSD